MRCKRTQLDCVFIQSCSTSHSSAHATTMMDANLITFNPPLGQRKGLRGSRRQSACAALVIAGIALSLIVCLSSGVRGGRLEDEEDEHLGHLFLAAGAQPFIFSSASSSPSASTVHSPYTGCPAMVNYDPIVVTGSTTRNIHHDFEGRTPGRGGPSGESSLNPTLALIETLKSAVADVWIGAFLPVHGAGERGIHSCANVTRDSIVAHQALKWATTVINQYSSSVNGKSVLLSFIPGVKVGVKVFDNCGHRDVALRQLISLLPELEMPAGMQPLPSGGHCPGSSHISAADTTGPSSTLLDTVGVIDAIGFSDDVRTADTLISHAVPLFPLSSTSSIVSADSLSSVILRVLTDLKWQRAALIHMNDEHSIQVIKQVGVDALKWSVCFKMVDSLGDLVMNGNAAAANEDEDSLTVLDKLRDWSKNLEENLPIVIIGHGEELSSFTQALATHWEVAQKFQWLFATLPPPEYLKSMPREFLPRLFFVTPYPGFLKEFETFWLSARRDVMNMASASTSLPSSARISLPNQAEQWLDEYFIRGPGTSADEPIDSLWRSYVAIPVIHAMFTFSHAIRNAWAERCKAKPGICPALAHMSRRDFVTSYLEPLETEHPAERVRRQVPTPDRGNSRRTPDDNNFSTSSNSGPSDNEVMKLALTKLTRLTARDGKTVLSFTEHIVYDSATRGGNFLQPNASLVSVTSPCSPESCDRCVKIRQSRRPGFNNRSRGNNTGDGSGLFGKTSASNAVEDIEDELVDNSALYATPPMIANFQRAWAFVTSILSGVGILGVLVCAIYFLMVFPITVGTTVLGYFILSGLLLLYTVNFAYIVPKSHWVCITRRLGMGTAYSMIFSGMLVKVMNTWRLMALRSSTSSGQHWHHQTARLNTPYGLLFVAGGLVLVQAVITVGWTAIQPPQPGLNEYYWTCSPTTAATGQHHLLDTEGIISLLYVSLLMVMACFFSCLTWHSQDNNQEPRWIFGSTVGIAVIWLFWAIFASSYSREQLTFALDFSTVCANLLSSLVIMASMYLRKIIIYAQLTRRAKAVAERSMKSRLQNNGGGFPTNMYGTVNKDVDAASTASWGLAGRSHSPDYADASSVNSGSFRLNRSKKSSKSNGSVKNGTVNGNKSAPFAADSDNADAISNCGSTTSSVQVQGTDLYPMDVYDCGSQFQPLSSLFMTYGNGGSAAGSSSSGKRGCPEGQALSEHTNGNGVGQHSLPHGHQDSSFI